MRVINASRIDHRISLQSKNVINFLQFRNYIAYSTYLLFVHVLWMKPRGTWLLRGLGLNYNWMEMNEYQEFDKRIFKERIYQEIKRNWMEMKREEGEPMVKRMSLYERPHDTSTRTRRST